jgi:hypothetical protein
MKKYSQDEIEARAGEFADRFENDFHPDLRIRGPLLIALFHLAARSDATDTDIDTAVAGARDAGHTWDEISAVLHAARPSVIAS